MEGATQHEDQFGHAGFIGSYQRIDAACLKGVTIGGGSPLLVKGSFSYLAPVYKKEHAWTDDQGKSYPGFMYMAWKSRSGGSWVVGIGQTADFGQPSCHNDNAAFLLLRPCNEPSSAAVDLFKDSSADCPDGTVLECRRTGPGSEAVFWSIDDASGDVIRNLMGTRDLSVCERAEFAMMNATPLHIVELS
jgi:hypothetical protein